MAASLQCQKCRTAIHIHDSLQDLNPASFKLLADAAPILPVQAPEQARSAAAQERQRRYHDAAHDASSLRPSDQPQAPEMSYIMLTESTVLPRPTESSKYSPGDQSKTKHTSGSGEKGYGGALGLSLQLKSTLQLFEVLSSRSDIDHPICSECTEILRDGLQKRQTSVLRERDAYVDFVKKAQADTPTEEEKARVKQSLADAKQREKIAFQELEALEHEKALLEEEIAGLDEESRQLDIEEETFWRSRNAFMSELRAHQQQHDSLLSQLAHDTKVLEALQRTNVFNDAFCIAHDGFFATINGLRLGRLAEHPVEWPEINAALGQTVLLIVVVAEKLHCEFKEHTLVPMGSTSKVILEEGKHIQGGAGRGKVFDLYSSGDLPLGLGGLFQGKFDNAMVELLTCLRQLGDHVTRKSEGSVVLPYRIEKDKIGDVSIRLSYGHDEHWTRSCKYLLTCCKFLLAHASHVDDTRRASR